MAYKQKNMFVDKKLQLSQITPLNLYNIHKSDMLFKKPASGSPFDSNELMHNQIRPVLIFLRAIGLVPISLLRGGTVKFCFWSLIMAYSLCLYLCLGITQWSLIMEYVSIITSKEIDYITSLFYVVLTNAMVISIVMPVLLWMDARCLTRYLNEWAEFQMAFHRVTGVELVLSVQKKCLFHTVRGCLHGLFAVSFHFVPPYVALWKLPAYCFLLSLMCSYITLWFSICICLSRAGNTFKLQLKKLLKGPASPQLISEYRILWLQLSHLVSNAGYALGKSASIFLALHLYTMTLTAYGFLYGIISNSSGELLTRSIGLGCGTLFGILTFFSICHFAHEVQTDVKVGVQEHLQHIRLWREKKEVQTEVSSFLQTITTNPPVISVRGFVNLDRSMFRSYTTAVVTYLIVLLQFNMDQPNTVSKSTNNTRVE